MRGQQSMQKWIGNQSFPLSTEHLGYEATVMLKMECRKRMLILLLATSAFLDFKVSLLLSALVDLLRKYTAESHVSWVLVLFPPLSSNVTLNKVLSFFLGSASLCVTGEVTAGYFSCSLSLKNSRIFSGSSVLLFS